MKIDAFYNKQTTYQKEHGLSSDFATVCPHCGHLNVRDSAVATGSVQIFCGSCALAAKANIVAIQHFIYRTEIVRDLKTLEISK